MIERLLLVPGLLRHPIARYPIALFLLLLIGTAVFALGSSNGSPGRSSVTVVRVASSHHEGAAANEQEENGCLSCHVGIEPMHASPAVSLSCTDCHGGDASAARGQSDTPGSDTYRLVQERAHVQPQFPEYWLDQSGQPTSANPVRAYTKSLREARDYIRFINPGDLRVARDVCGGCHVEQVNAVMKSPMRTSSIFWAAASYANGILGDKVAYLGEAYTEEGEPAAVLQREPLSPRDRKRGAIDALDRENGRLAALVPLPRWEKTQPGEYFRAFERGGLMNLGGFGAVPFTPFFPDIGNPSPLEEPGRPDIRLSERGRGTGARVSPAVINLHKTRLNDPHLSFFGTNDHPGDFRSSGCTACHVVYANDRDPVHSGPWAGFGNRGRSDTSDSTICGERDRAAGAPCANTDSGHPIRHRLTRAIPTSQCMVCHMHQPNAFVNTYLGYTMWDYETDGRALWPPEQHDPTEEERIASYLKNPEGAAARGRWTDDEFLADVGRLEEGLEHTRFADYHGHGWIFRAVFKRDRQGRLLDEKDEVVPFSEPKRFEEAVHLRDIHAEKGMHCVDCHFSQDAHGDGLIHGEYGNAIEIECRDCHGDIDHYTDLRTTGPASPPGGTDLSLGTTPFGRRRFAWKAEPEQGLSLWQRSMLDPNVEWQVSQVKDSVTPDHPEFNELASYAKTIVADGGWGDPEVNPLVRVHRTTELSCSSCHSSWITSCSGCHLPQESNIKSEMNHYEGQVLKQFATYNPQVIRTDAYMLGKAGNTKDNKITPVRSSSALVLSSTNINRKTFYHQQAPISAPGFSSQAFNPHAPHTVRKRETKRCSDCHLSGANDNNAWMANLLIHGTNFPNFIGRNVWVGEGKKGFEAVEVTQAEEPQAVIGSTLHQIAYPRFYEEHQEHGGELEHSHHHPSAGGEIRSLQLRGEFLFTAKGRGGFEVFDVANIANRDFSEAMVTAPVSPIGQRTSVKTRFATAVALPTTMPMAPTRKTQFVEANQEQQIHPIYRYAFIGDREEGLIAVNVDTLTDANPRNNFLSRDLTFNPEGTLSGTEGLTIAGNYAYLVGSHGLSVVDLNDPLQPRVVARLPNLGTTTSVAVQFRYAFVAHQDGLKVVEITDPENPSVVAEVGGLGPVHNLYLARTYAYLAAGERGLVIVDIERSDRPQIELVWNADGALRDTRDVKLGSTNASLFAYIADGVGGLKVAQLTSPDWTPAYLGFSPRPDPRLIASYHTHGPALAISKGLDRDRAVDESGNQVSVFNRLGARPLNLQEQQRLYLKNGNLYFTDDDPPAQSRVRVFSTGARHRSSNAGPETDEMAKQESQKEILQRAFAVVIQPGNGSRRRR